MTARRLAAILLIAAGVLVLALRSFEVPGTKKTAEIGPLELLVYVSRMMTLEPGDVILTGTPAGVGPLVDGDRVEVEIPGVGVLANPVEAWKRA